MIVIKFNIDYAVWESYIKPLIHGTILNFYCKSDTINNKLSKLNLKYKDIISSFEFSTFFNNNLLYYTLEKGHSSISNKMLNENSYWSMLIKIKNKKTTSKSKIIIWECDIIYEYRK